MHHCNQQTLKFPKIYNLNTRKIELKTDFVGEGLLSLCFGIENYAVVSAKKYVVEVFTGNISEAGTNANVFLKMYGNRGESKEEKLRQSETNKDKFERGRVSLSTVSVNVQG